MKPEKERAILQAMQQGPGTAGDIARRLGHQTGKNTSAQLYNLQRRGKVRQIGMVGHRVKVAVWDLPAGSRKCRQKAAVIA